MSDQPVVKSPADWAFDGIDALVARCKRAEADADRLAPFIDHDNDCATRYSDVLHPTCTCGVYEAARLHDEAKALR